MTKSGKIELVAVLVAQGFNKVDAEKGIDAILLFIHTKLLAGESVVLKNVGTLVPSEQKKKSRKSFGREIEIKDRLKVKFVKSKSLKNDEGLVDFVKQFLEDRE